MPGTLPPLPPHNPSAVPGNVCSEFFETVSRDERRVGSNFVRDLWRECVGGEVFWLSQVCLHLRF